MSLFASWLFYFMVQFVTLVDFLSDGACYPGEVTSRSGYFGRYVNV